MNDVIEKKQLNVQVEVSLLEKLQEWADAETEGNVSLVVRKLLRQEVTRRQQSPLLPTVDSGEKIEAAKPAKRASSTVRVAA